MFVSLDCLWRCSGEPELNSIAFIARLVNNLNLRSLSWSHFFSTKVISPEIYMFVLIYIHILTSDHLFECPHATCFCYDWAFSIHANILCFISIDKIFYSVSLPYVVHTCSVLCATGELI